MSRRRVPDTGWLAHYRTLISGWARGRSNPHEAEDAVQDAAARFLSVDAVTVRHPGAYLHRSALNGLAANHRRHQIAPMMPLDDLDEADHPVAGDTEAAAHLQQLSQALAEALAELPPVCQQVFAWHRLEGWTVPEIAAHMGLSVSSVEKYLTRCMRHLHQRLQRFSS